MRVTRVRFSADAESELRVQEIAAPLYREQRYRGLGLRYHSRLIADLMKSVRGRILDAGCGVGILHDLYPGLDITGVDISEPMLRHHSGRRQLASVLDLPFPEGDFDTVVCRGVLHHLPKDDCRRALDEIFRVLRKGGSLICWEPNRSWLTSWIRRLVQRTGHFGEHHSAFEDLPGLLAGRRFQVTEIKYEGFLAYPAFGFPDILNLGGIFAPFYSLLAGVDEFLSGSSLKKLGFAIRVTAVKI